MAVVFWKEVCRQYQMQMASTKLYRVPRRKVCQLAHSRTQRPINPKRNSLLNLDFFASCDTERLEYHQNNQQKITLKVVKH
jgi:hypothetical protein